MGWLDGITDSMDMSLSKFCDIAEDREAWRAIVRVSQRVEYNLARAQQQQQLGE